MMKKKIRDDVSGVFYYVLRILLAILRVVLTIVINYVIYVKHLCILLCITRAIR